MKCGDFNDPRAGPPLYDSPGSWPRPVNGGGVVLSDAGAVGVEEDDQMNKTNIEIIQ